MDLYRYISFEEFMSIITLHHLHFVQPTQWEDSHEGSLYRLLDKKENKEILLSMLYDRTKAKDENEKAYRILLNYYKIMLVKYNWYGQCWTYKSNESDAFWRIYSHNRMAIRIHTTDSKLKDVLKPDKYLFKMKKVKYDEDSSENDLLRKQIEMVLKKNNTTESYFHKRKAFSHEQEYRVLVLPKKNYDDNGEGRNLFLESATVFSQIQLKDRIKKSPIKNKEDCIAACMETIKAQRFELHKAPPLYISFESASDIIDDVLISPLAEDWYVKLVKKVCKDNGIECKGKSNLYDPVL